MDSSKWGNQIIIFNNCVQPDSSTDFWKARRGAAGSSYYLLKALTVATVTRPRIEGICLRIKPLCVRGIFRLHKSYVFFTNVRQTFVFALTLHWPQPTQRELLEKRGTLILFTVCGPASSQRGGPCFLRAQMAKLSIQPTAGKKCLFCFLAGESKHSQRNTMNGPFCLTLFRRHRILVFS